MDRRVLVLSVVVALAACGGSSDSPAAPSDDVPSGPTYINIGGAFWMTSPEWLETGEGDPFIWRYEEWPCEDDPEQTNYRQTGPRLMDLLNVVADPAKWDDVGTETDTEYYECPVGGGSHIFYDVEEEVYRATEDSIYFRDGESSAWIMKGGDRVGFVHGESQGQPITWYRQRYLEDESQFEAPGWSRVE